MAGIPGQISDLPKELPDEGYRLKPTRFDGRSWMGKHLKGRKQAFAEDPEAVLRRDLEDAYHAVTLWRVDKERKYRVKKMTPEHDKIYLGLCNSWLGIYTRVAAQHNGHAMSPEERIAAAFAPDDPAPELTPAPASEAAP